MRVRISAAMWRISLALRWRIACWMLMGCVPLALAPKGVKTTLQHMQNSPWAVLMSPCNGGNVPFAQAAAATAAAAAVAAGAIMAANSSGLTHRYHEPSSAEKHSKGFRRSVASPIKLERCTEGDKSSREPESEPEDYDASEYESDAEQPEQPASRAAPKRRAKSRLWTAEQFPEGTDGAANWDMANLTAAQNWECPCKDRRNCIGGERCKLLDLYEYRKQFRTTNAKGGGFRDASRKDLESHYDRRSGSFTRSFVVGLLGDCCAASSGLAKGISFATFASSRTDVTKERAWHAGRCKLKAKVQSEERAHLEAYIRDLRAELEGPKGGSRAKDKWSLPKKTAPQRWEDYKRKRKLRSLPIIGSPSLFEKIWREHDEITEYGAKGHAKCDHCGELQVDRLKYEGRSDKLREVEAKQVCSPRKAPYSGYT